MLAQLDLVEKSYLSDEDSDLESYRERNHKIQQLQQQQMAYKEQMLRFLSQRSQDEVQLSPIAMPLETNYTTNQSCATQQFETVKSYQSNQLSQYQNKMLTKNAQTPTRARPNYLQAQNLQLSPISAKPYTRPFNVVPLQKSVATQTDNKQACKLAKGFKFEVTLKKVMDQGPHKSTQTQRAKKPTQNSQRCKTDFSDYSFYSSIKLPKSPYATIQKQQQNQQQIKSTNLVKPPKQENKNPLLSVRKVNESWYSAQKQWLKDKDERAFLKKVELEEDRSYSKDSFRPKIRKETQDIVNQKYNHASFEQRLQQYLVEKKHRQILKKLEEDEERNAQRVRMSPMSRKILRSLTPRLGKHDQSHSFTATNVSYFNQTQLQ